MRVLTHRGVRLANLAAQAELTAAAASRFALLARAVVEGRRALRARRAS